MFFFSDGKSLSGFAYHLDAWKKFKQKPYGFVKFGGAAEIGMVLKNDDPQIRFPKKPHRFFHNQIQVFRGI